MPSDYVRPYREVMEFVFSHYDKFVEICDDETWKGKFGGWPVGEQFYHALAASAMLAQSITGKKADNPLPDAGNLATHDQAAPDMHIAKQFLIEIKKFVLDAIDSLSDADLLKKNEMVSQKFGKSVTNAAVIGLMTGHLQYHLGSCDAALREKGKEGSW